MAQQVLAYELVDELSVDQNVNIFRNTLSTLNGTLGVRLGNLLVGLMQDPSSDKSVALTNLRSALDVEQTPEDTSYQKFPPAPAAENTVAIGWFLEQLEIEGFRGINNEGAALVLKFRSDKVNSVSGPNGVGKSSVFDAVTYALTGSIPKLDKLQAAEGAENYYLNRFHPGGVGTIKLTITPDDGTKSIEVRVTRYADGTRTTTAPAGFDADKILATLNRDFVLLDAHTFHSFIMCKSLDRGRDFAGLLGLSRYSALRKGLQAMSNTRAFNNQLAVELHKTAQLTADRLVKQARTRVRSDYLSLVKKELLPEVAQGDAACVAHHSLAQITLMSAHCNNRTFSEIDIDGCAAAIQVAEASPDRQRLVSLIRDQEIWTVALRAEPTEADIHALRWLAAERDARLAQTQGALLHELCKVSERVLVEESWANKALCPVCGYENESSVLSAVQTKLGDYAAVEAASLALTAEWATRGWAELTILEDLTLIEGEVRVFRDACSRLQAASCSVNQVQIFVERLSVIRDRAQVKLSSLASHRATLESSLPPSLVAMTTAIEAARRLQRAWADLESAEVTLNKEIAWFEKTNALKMFLDDACAIFSKAESNASARRLKAVQPICSEIFQAIMHEAVVPALRKRIGTEELSLSLSNFFSLQDVSVQALLSESYRNALAAAVYFAAAKLYGGAARFMILDDITSSFDAGHQFHLLEVIRTRLARPGTSGGPQVILFSHDTMLEKLFNKHANTGGWWHQRLQGNTRTVVLPQTSAIDKVKDTTRELLNAGRVDDAAPYIRQYLEFSLEEIICRCSIPVPFDLAFNESTQLAQAFLNAIDAAVRLNYKAGMLVLSEAQQLALNANVATITGNYLAHWSTGSTQNFAAGALLGVLDAIDAFKDCFRFDHAGGAGTLRYYKSLSQRS